jgi:hypothetical protein
VVEGEERVILWNSLKERAAQNDSFALTDSTPMIDENDFLKLLLEWDKIKEGK